MRTMLHACAAFMLVLSTAGHAGEWHRLVYVGRFFSPDEDDATKKKGCASFWFEKKTYRLDPAADGSKKLVGLYGNLRYGVWGPNTSSGCKVGEKHEHVVFPSVMRMWSVVATPSSGSTYAVKGAYSKANTTFSYQIPEHERKPFESTISVRGDTLMDSWTDATKKVEKTFRKSASADERRIEEAIRRFLVATGNENCRAAVNERMSRIVNASAQERDGWCRAAAERRRLVGDVVSLTTEKLDVIDEWEPMPNSIEGVGKVEAPSKSAFVILFVQFERVRVPAAALVDLSDESDPRVIMLL